MSTGLRFAGTVRGSLDPRQVVCRAAPAWDTRSTVAAVPRSPPPPPPATMPGTTESPNPLHADLDLYGPQQL
jgi:hypothetical protein